VTSDDRYSDLVRRHFDTPSNSGPLPGASPAVFTGAAGRRELGIHVLFQARIEAGAIDEIRFQAYGCPHTLAACSLATERLAGRPATALDRTDVMELAETLGVPVEKAGRMLIVQDALHQCFQAWENRRLAGKQGS